MLRIPLLRKAKTVAHVEIERAAHLVAATSSVLLILLGLVVLAGWVFNIGVLTSFVPGYATMKVNTAFSFVVAGVTLMLQLRPNISARRTNLARALAFFIVAICVTTLGEHAFGVDLRIDRPLFNAIVHQPGSYPGRMGSNTAITFTLLGMASFLLDSKNKRLRRVSEILAIVALLIAFIAGIGYLLNVEALYSAPGYTSLAIHTALGCAILSIALLAARPRRGVFAILVQNNSAGIAARRFIPLMVAAILFFAWLEIQGQEAGFFGADFGLALMVAACTTVLSSIVLWNANEQGKVEELRQEAEEAKQTMNALVESADDAIMTESLDGGVRSWNPAAERLLDYRAEDILGRDVMLLLPDDRRDEELMIIDRIKSGKTVARFETVRRRKDGSLVDVSLTISPLRDRAGTIIGASNIMRDITDRKRVAEHLSSLNAQLAEQVQLRSEELQSVQHDLTTILNALPTMVAYWDRDYINRISNRAFCDLYFEKGPEALRGVHVKQVFGDDMLQKSGGYMEAALRGERTIYECTLAGRNGAPLRHLHLHLVPDIVDGVAQGFYVVGHDVTALTEAKRLLGESEKFLRRVERVAGVGGFMLDFSTNAQRWTGQAYRIHELDESQPPSLDLQDSFVVPSARDYWRDTLRLAREQGTGYDIEVPITTAQNRAVWVRVVGEVECDDGVPIRVVGAIQDITERRALEQHLREASADADKANKAKSEFLANMSHEIRTPLNAVIGLGYLLEQTVLGEDQRQFLTKIQFASRALLGVINNVLDLSKIEAGEMLLEDEPFDLLALLGELSQMLSPQAASKGIELMLHPAATLPRRIMGDSSRLRQILTNLLNNAIKFTESGHVELNVVCSEQSSDRIRLRCEVKDTGIGIEPDALARLFTPFTQADASMTRRFGGTGLGLSIARRFVVLMGGEIGVTSSVAVGTTFWLEIPVRVASNDLTNADGARGLRVFVADSTGDVPEGLGVMVRALGWSPKVVGTVEQLLSMLRATPADAWPDVLVVDPHGQDTDAATLITGFEKECAHGTLPPVVVVAGDSSIEQDQQHMRPADVVLLKPVTSSSLFNAIHTAVWTRTDSYDRVLQSTDIDERHAQWLAGIRVLVVDDSELNLEVAQRILEKQGAIIATCGNGAEALEYMRIHHLEIDLVLMDVQMPILDGYEATRRIRSELQLHTLPIIALTGGALAGERQRALEAGMNDFLSKPFDPQTLIFKARRVVEQARGAPIPMVIDHSNPATSAADIFLVAGIDSGIAQRMFGDDSALFKSSLGRMLHEFAELALPVSLHDEGARHVMMARAHKLKGSAGMIGATRIARLAGAAEAALQEGRGNDVVEKILRQLASALTTLHESAAPLLKREIEGLSVAAHAANVADHPSDTPAQIRELQALIESQNLAATDQFSALSPALRELLDESRFDELREAMDDLDFPLAARLLRKAVSTNPRTRAVQIRVSGKASRDALVKTSN